MQLPLFKSRIVMSILTVSLLSSTAVLAQQRPGGGGRPGEGNHPGAPATGSKEDVVKPNEPPPKLRLDYRRMEEITQEAARRFAGDVLDYIGKAYQVRYSIRGGIFEAKNKMGDYDNDSIVRRTSLYGDQFNSNAKLGITQGQKDGATYASRSAYNLADSDINQAIDKAIETRQPIVLVPNPRLPNFSGSSPSLSSVKSVVDYVLADSSSIHNSIRFLVRSGLSSTFYNEIFDIGNLFNLEMTEIPRAFKFDEAFENWNRNYFNSSDSYAARNFYREIQDSNVYESPRENERAFRNSFINSFGRMLEREWDRTVQSRYDQAMDLGNSIYTDAANSRAEKLGANEGILSTYQVNHKQAYDQNFIGYYNQSYPAIEDEIRHHAHITQIQASVVTTSGSAQVALGDGFDIILETITNRGMVDGVVKIEAAAGGLAQATTNNPQSITVQGLTRDNEAKRFSGMAIVTGMKDVDESMTVSAVVNGQTFSKNFTSSFEEKVRRMTQTGDQNISNAILNLIVPAIKNQYSKMSGYNDEYKNRNPDRYLVRIRALYDSLSEPERAKLRTYKSQLKGAFGKQPGFFSGGGQIKVNDWEEAMKMFKEMKM
jgi:hypothetical protein